MPAAHPPARGGGGEGGAPAAAAYRALHPPRPRAAQRTHSDQADRAAPPLRGGRPASPGSPDHGGRPRRAVAPRGTRTIRPAWFDRSADQPLPPAPSLPFCLPAAKRAAAWGACCVPAATRGHRGHPRRRIVHAADDTPHPCIPPPYPVHCPQEAAARPVLLKIRAVGPVLDRSIASSRRRRPVVRLVLERLRAQSLARSADAGQNRPGRIALHRIFNFAKVYLAWQLVRLSAVRALEHPLRV